MARNPGDEHRASVRPDRERDPDAQRLLHELHVHQIELETQNEELRRARVEMETALAGYTELFDFAPIGYVTVGTDGAILEINHVAARILSRPRGPLVGTAFLDLVTLDDRSVYGALIGRALDSSEREEAEVEIWPI